MIQPIPRPHPCPHPVDAATGRIISGPEIHARGVAEDDAVFDDVAPKIVAALKDEFGLGHGHAMAIVALLKGGKK